MKLGLQCTSYSIWKDYFLGTDAASTYVSMILPKKNFSFNAGNALG